MTEQVQNVGAVVAEISSNKTLFRMYFANIHVSVFTFFYFFKTKYSSSLSL